jgi:hypothetical protein
MQRTVTPTTLHYSLRYTLRVQSILIAALIQVVGPSSPLRLRLLHQYEPVGLSETQKESCQP